jgi:carotenoid cleavage dioxygenase-like enzyme
MNQHSKSTDRREVLLGGSALLAGACSLPLPLRLAALEQTTVAPSQPVPAWESDNRFLSGAFAPVFDERDDADLIVKGEIPRSLHGVFVRNGPNPMFKPDGRYAYPFDGTGMLHAIYLENGRARYRNRWVVTEDLAAERASGHRLFNSTFSPGPHADLANTNIVYHGGRYLALYEGGRPYEITRDLETRGLFSYGGKFVGRMSAHPKRDPVTGELMSIAYDGRTGMLTYLRADASGRLDRVVPIQAPWATMIHDIGITEHHVIAVLGPAVFDTSGKGPPLSWQPDRGARIAIIPRGTKGSADVQWIEAAPFFQFHTMNAFADGDRIDLVVPWYDSFSLTTPAKRLELHRLVIDTRKRTVQDHALDDRACEFARINEGRLGRRARYGCVGFREPRAGESPQVGAFEAVARYDLATGTKRVHRFAPGMTVCEPVFVEDGPRKAEDEGFILSFVHHAAEQGSSFVILDARNLESDPLAIISLPRRVPAGLHGSWFPA